MGIIRAISQALAALAKTALCAPFVAARRGLILVGVTVATLASGTAPAVAAGAQASADAQQSAAVSTGLQQAANVSPSQVSDTALCAAAQPGDASCDAIALTLTSSGDLVRPDTSPSGGAQLQARGATLSSDVAEPDGEPGASAEPGTGTPGWLQQAYDTTWLSANRGSGDTVALVDAYDDPTAAADLATYRSSYGLPACTVASGCLAIINQNGQTQSQAQSHGGSWPVANSSWEGEETLDLDAVSAICPSCHIVLVEANSNSLSNFEVAEAAAASYPGVDQISNSWGATASGTPPAGDFTFSGISVLAASGDSGYQQSSQVQYPAAFGGVTAVGGTSLTIGSSGARGFTETTWSGAGSSCATHVAQPTWQSGLSCAGRSTSDIAADADPDTGLLTYGTAQGGWALFGGTSLATPLAAAFEAITRIPGATSPQWSYSDASELNDVTAGNNDTASIDTGGTCTTALSYLCNAGSGFDGPTGNGSIDGDLAVGGPGIGGPDACAPGACSQAGAGYATATTSSGAQLQAQIDPNGLQTSYHWEYGSTTSFGAQSTIATLAASAVPATTETTLTGLSASTTYYYRLVSSNADGTTYGYTFSFTTAAAAQQSSNASQQPSSGSGGSQQLSDSSNGSAPVTLPASTTTSASTGTTPVATTPTATTPSQSPDPGSGPKPAAASPGTASLTLLRSGGGTRAAVGDVLTAGLPSGAQAAADAITQLLRCLTTCTVVSSSGSHHRLTGVDAGALMRVRYAPSSGGAFSSAYVGPVLSPKTAGTVLGSARSATLRTSTGTALAVAHTSLTGKGRQRATSVRITRASHVGGVLRAWLCPTALDAQGHPRACSAPVALSQSVTLRKTLAGPLAVVVQR